MTNRKSALDFAERVGATFIQAFVAVALVSGVNDRTALETAGVAGALAAAKFVQVRLNEYLGTEAK